MFYKIFSGMDIKKVTHGGAGGKWGNLPNFLLEVELLLFTNIVGGSKGGSE